MKTILSLLLFVVSSNAAVVLGQTGKSFSGPVFGTVAGGGNGLLANLYSVWEMEQADNGDVVDATGNSRIATHTGTDQRTVRRVEGSFSHDSAQSSGWTNNSSTFFNTNGSFSAYAWVSNSVDADTLIGFSRYGTTTNKFTIYFDNAGTFSGGNQHWKFVVRNTNGASNIAIASSTVDASAGWHMVVVTWDSSTTTAQISVDGETFVSTGSTGQAWNQGFNSGTAPNSGFSFGMVAGPIDESAFWIDRVLTQANVTSLYASGAGFFYSGGGWN